MLHSQVLQRYKLAIALFVGRVFCDVDQSFPALPLAQPAHTDVLVDSVTYQYLIVDKFLSFFDNALIIGCIFKMGVCYSCDIGNKVSHVLLGLHKCVQQTCT